MRTPTLGMGVLTMSLPAALALALAAAPARADDAKDQQLGLLGWLAEEDMAPDGTALYRVAIREGGVTVDPPEYTEPGAGNHYVPRAAVVAYSADKKVAWIAADLDAYEYCGAEECEDAPPFARLHATMLVETTAPPHPVAFHIGRPIGGADQAKAVARGVQLDPIADHVEPGAADAVAAFKAGLADPKALAASVSPRKDVVLYGSSKGERWVGGAAVKAQLAKWGLGLAVIDGIQAGAVDGGKVAWVAANVKGHALKRPKDKDLPYRVLAIYERGAAGWQLVQIQFSYVLPPR